jgi:hypothetical protein
VTSSAFRRLFGVRSTLLFALLIVVSAGSAQAAMPEAGEPVVVEAEGSYTMGDRDTKQEARDLALYQAKRNAIEKVGTRVASSSKVENFELIKDDVYNQAIARMQTEILKENWTPVGETLMVSVRIRGTVYLEELGEAPDLNEEPTPDYVDTEAATAPDTGQELPEDTIPTDDRSDEAAVDMRTETPDAPLVTGLERARSLVDRNQWQKALAELNRLERSHPRVGEVHFLKGKSLWALGNSVLGRRSLQRACALDYVKACKLLSDLERPQPKPQRNTPPRRPQRKW